MISYEAVLNQINAVPKGDTGDDRTITWLTNAKVIGIARNSRGHLELFLSGEELSPRTSTVKAAMHYHAWHRDTPSRLNANRICLPALGHFDRVGAFIGTELLREKADSNLERAFAITEPLIELAIKRMEISEEAILGLFGELLLLDVLCRRAADHQVGLIVQAWEGWHRSARDFTWEGTGVEIKTTTNTTSNHAIHGIHQVEPAPSSDDTVGERCLLLVSIGLRQEVLDSDAFSISSLVESIIKRLKDAKVDESYVVDFVKHVSVYGAESGIGYEHATMANEAPFATRYSVTFVRGYDMADSDVKVLRRDDVITHQHVDVQSVAYRVELPTTINLRNPIAGVWRVVDAILGQHG